MKHRVVFLSAFLVVLLSGLVPELRAQDQDPATSGVHRRRFTKPFPHRWKYVQAVHKKANPFPGRKPGAGAVSDSQIQSAFQPAQSSQPVAQTLPLWEYSVNANSTNYQGYVVGRNPFYNGHRSTTVQTYIVPVILTFPSGDVFDPTAQDPCAGDSVMDLVQQSPIFQTADFTFTDSNGQNPVDVGTTQATDAFQRANFWTYVSPNANTQLPYHTVLSAITLPAVNVSIPAGDGQVQNSSCPIGMMDYTWWDDYVENTLIPSLAPEGVGPSNLPIFIFDSVVMYLNGDPSQCCALGDHGAYNPTANTFQTYAVTDYDTSGDFYPDVYTLSHDMGQWMNDPDVANPTPNWVNPYDGSCSDTYEVGNVLVGQAYQIGPMANGVTYNLEELTYFSWFYLQTPSIGAGGWYSDQGFLTSLPSTCSPGSPSF